MKFWRPRATVPQEPLRVLLILIQDAPEFRRSRPIRQILQIQASLIEDALQRTGGNSLVIRHSDAHLVLSQPYVRPGLPEDGEPRPFERANNVDAR